MSIKIRTQRNYQTWPSWDLVYEWEDVLAKELKGSFVYESKYLDNKYVKRIPDIYRILVTKGSTTIAFDMTPSLQDNLRNTKDVIPCIIDFLIKNRHKAQRKAKFYINKCRSASCMQSGWKRTSA